MNRTRIRALALASASVVAVAALAGCSVTTGEATPSASHAAATHEVKKILFDYPFTSLPVFTVVSEAAKAEAAKQGVAIEFTNDNMDLGQQVTNLTTYVNSDVDAVVSFAVDPASLQPLVGQYQGAGKYWITYGGNIPGEDASLQFSFEKSGRMLGEDAGKWIQEHLGGKAKVLILQDLTIQLGKDRTKGIEEGLKTAAPDAEVVSEQQAVTPEQGLSVTNSVLAQHPDVDVVLAAVGDAAQGAYQALVSSGRSETDASTYVGGLDGNLTLFQAMKDGKFVRALVSVKATELGKAVVDVPIALGKGDTSVKSFDAPVYLVTKDSSDLDDWIASFQG